MSGRINDQGDPLEPSSVRSGNENSAAPGGSPAPAGDIPGAAEPPPEDDAKTERPTATERSSTDVNVEASIADDGVLSVTAEDLELPAPVLAEAKISPDVAAEASLHDAAAEARSVEQEAQEAGTLAGGRPASGSAVSKDAVARKIEKAASKAKTDILGDEAAAGSSVDRPGTPPADPPNGDIAPGAKASGTDSHAEEEDFPASPGPDSNRKENMRGDDEASGSGSAAPGPVSPGDEGSGDEDAPADYPATPTNDQTQNSAKADARKDKRTGPGAAKASEPHECDSGERRRGRRAMNAPPTPDRPSGAGPQDPADEEQHPAHPQTEPLPAQEPAQYPPAEHSQYRPPWSQGSASAAGAGPNPGPGAAPPEPGPYGAAYGALSTRPASQWQAETTDPSGSRPRRKKSKAPLFIGLGISLAVILGLVLIIIALTSLFGSDEPEADGAGVIAEEVSPFDFEEGQCFTDFTDATASATVVSCDMEHEAQLVNTFLFEDDAEFPGEEALIERADELCRNTQLNEAAQQYELRQQTAYPQSESWAQGDRRVDCFIRVPDGGITGSLID